MAGTLLLTFDCEGKWGVVDRLGPRYECLTTPALEAAYGRVLDLLRQYRMAATFAFTGAFTMSAGEFDAMRERIAATPAGQSPWLRRALAAVGEGGGDGWFSPACFGAVTEAGVHEIGSHGFSHMPWGAPWASREVLDSELALARLLPGMGADKVETFIYPRNQVAHPDLLPLHGFHIYRAARRSFGRPANFMRELNFLAASEPFGPGGGLPVVVPAGYFLNWRLGLRRCIPVAWTVARWEHILRHAARSDGVVHAWTHPENFIDGHSMFSLLERILQFAARERDAGRLRIVTCKELVRLSPASQRLLRPQPEPRAIIGA